MKTFLLLFLFLSSFTMASDSVLSDLEKNPTILTHGQIRAQLQTIKELNQKIYFLKNNVQTERYARRGCDDTPSVTCVPKCNIRGATGSCIAFGSDFCGVDASCSPNCTIRGATGDCISYGADICN